MGIQLKNNVSSTLAAAISASDVGMTVATGTGAQFPTLGASDYFYATLESSQGTQEIVKVTARSGDNMTIVRAQDGSTANSFGIGARIELRINAAAITAYDPAGTGAVSTTVQTKLRETVSVKDFGAVGDGVTDDTAAIQAALTTGATVNITQGSYKVTGMLAATSDIISDGATLLGYIADAVTHPFILNTGANVVGLKFDGTNCVTGVGAIGTVSAGVIVDGCKMQSFNGYAFYGVNTDATIQNCVIDNCGRYSDREVIYLNTNGQAINNSVYNSKYKPIISGSNAANVVFRSNLIDTSTGAASDGLYFSQYSTDCVAINNVVSNTAGHSFKASEYTERCVAQANVFDNSAMSQGGTDNKIINNQCGVIIVFGHDIDPDTNTLVMGNKCTRILFGSGASDEMFGTIIKDNYIDGDIDVGVSGCCVTDLVIENNVINGRIDLTLVDSFKNPGVRPGPVNVVNNRIFAPSGTGRALRLEGQFATDNEVIKIVCENNVISGQGSGSSTGQAIRLFGSTDTICNSNIVSGYATGITIGRLRRLRCENNLCSDDVTLGFNFPEIDSNTYWPGSDFVINNNSGTRDETSHTFRKVQYYISGKDLFASAIPVSGYYRQGEYRINTAPSAGGKWGWVCTTAGNPGTWKPFGAIDA